MTDNTAIHNKGFSLSNDILATLASSLNDHELAAWLREFCNTTQSVGSHAVILQPFYNRLYAIDNTLPPLLPQEGTLAAFKQAFEKIRSRQQFEITYLTQYHPAIMAKPECVQVLQEDTVSLESLETINAVLDKVNSEIITARIDITSSSLDLEGVGITRLPVTLFQDPAYANFWQNLIRLLCHNNQLTTLNVQDLAMLQTLLCSNNQLTELNVQGLAKLQWLHCKNNSLSTLNVRELESLLYLDCENNKLTILNVQGLESLICLRCDNNPLKTLILAGVHPNIKNSYADLERKLLFNKLSQTNSPEARQAIIHRLGADYTYKNCLKYCPIYAAKLFAFDSTNGTYRFASTVLSQACAFLPSFEATNTVPEKADLKRKRDEDEVDREELSKDTDNQPDLKRRKRK